MYIRDEKDRLSFTGFQIQKPGQLFVAFFTLSSCRLIIEVTKIFISQLNFHVSQRPPHFDCTWANTISQ